MSIGIWQILIIFAIVFLLFGAGRVPRIMGDIARGIKNFKSEMEKNPEKPENTIVDKNKE